jgi:DNA primase
MRSGPLWQQGSPTYSEQQIRNAVQRSGVRVAGEIATHYIVFCDFHNNNRTPSAEIDKRTGQFYCFSCRRASDIFALLRRNGMSYFQALRAFGDDNTDIVEEVNRFLEEKNHSFDSSIVDKLHANVWGKGSSYFHSRNIYDESIRKFQLGYSSIRDMVTVPVHSPTGVLWGFVGRSVTGKRFQNSSGLPKSQTLFNLHRVYSKSKVFVVESSFDAIRLDQVGFAAVATLGAGISKVQIDLLTKTFDDIVVVPDDDDAGRLMVKKIQDTIAHAQTLMLDGAHDIGNLSDDELVGLDKSVDLW